MTNTTFQLFVDAAYSYSTTHINKAELIDVTITLNASAACIVANVRNDWNAATQLFTATKLTPDKEIHVCPWSNVPIPIATTLVAGPIYYGAIGFNLYSDTVQNASGVSWPVLVFLPISNTLTPGPIDMLAFVRYLYSNLSLLTAGETIAGLEVGIRVVSGKADWSIQSLSVMVGAGIGWDVTPNPYIPPVPPPIPTPQLP